MSRGDKYCYPDTDTLINNYDIRLEGELATLERQITAIRIAELEQKEPQPNGYNFKKLCDIHKHIFGNLYEWAGKPRTVDIQKDKTIFCRAAFIGSAADDIFSRLKKDNFLQHLPKEQFIDKLADYMTDINALHPFREGNGRTQRTFFKELSAAAGYNLDFDKADKDVAITADIAAMNGNMKILKNMLSRIVEEVGVDKEQPQKPLSALDSIRQKGKDFADTYDKSKPDRSKDKEIER